MTIGKHKLIDIRLLVVDRFKRNNIIVYHCYDANSFIHLSIPTTAYDNDNSLPCPALQPSPSLSIAQ
jgi:hypothetical protein